MSRSEIWWTNQSHSPPRNKTDALTKEIVQRTDQSHSPSIIKLETLANTTNSNEIQPKENKKVSDSTLEMSTKHNFAQDAISTLETSIDFASGPTGQSSQRPTDMEKKDSDNTATDSHLDIYTCPFDCGHNYARLSDLRSHISSLHREDPKTPQRVM